jgi:hypothetical protein
MILKNNYYKWFIKNNDQAFRVEPILIQTAITTGEPLFQVDYEDHDFDNLVF